MAAALVVAFYVVAVALVAALVVLAIVASTVWTVGCALLAALVAATALSVSRFRPVVPAGPSFPVDPAVQPEFWALVRAVADETGTRAPAEITLVSVADLALLEDARFLGLRRGRRTLLIGIPVLAGLTVGQLRATLVQEFARDAFVVRGRQQVDRAVAATRRNRLLRGVFTAFARLYRAAAEPGLRSCAGKADADAARRTGRETVLAALRLRAAIAQAWPEFAATRLAEDQQAAEFAKAFREFIADREPVAVADRARVAALERLPAGAAEPDDRPAFDLFQGDALS